MSVTGAFFFVSFLLLIPFVSSLAGPPTRVRIGQPLQPSVPGQPAVTEGTLDDGTSVVVIGREWTPQDAARKKRSREFFRLTYNGMDYMLYLSKRTKNALGCGEGGYLGEAKAAIHTVPRVNRVGNGTVEIVWRDEGATANTEVFSSSKVQKDVEYRFFLPDEAARRLLKSGKEEALADLRALLETFLNFATTPGDARNEGTPDEWFQLPVSPSEEERRVGRLYDEYSKQRSLMPPVHRSEDGDGQTKWVIGKGWRDPTNADMFNDGQAALKFTVGDGHRFEVYLARDTQLVLEEQGLLKSVIDRLSTSPSMPAPIASWKPDSRKPTDKVVLWGGDAPYDNDFRNRPMYDGFTYYHVQVPTAVIDACQKDGNGGRSWTNLIFLLRRTLLAIAEALIDVPRS